MFCRSWFTKKMGDHEHGPQQQTINLVISFDPNAQDLLNAVVMAVQGSLSHADSVALGNILQTTRSLLKQATAISTAPPTPKG